MERLRVGVLISGRGSNLQALIDAAADPAYPAEIVTVISNRGEAAGLARAASAESPQRRSRRAMKHQTAKHAVARIMKNGTLR